MNANYRTAADVLDGWRDDVLSGQPPVLYPGGAGGLERIELGPGLVTLLGGAPGAGKTALVMQLVTDAMRHKPDLRVLVANVEMTPGVLLDRQLARLSGVDLTTIRHRRLDARHADRIDQALATLGTLADRLAFLSPPFDLGNAAAAADAHRADLLVLDYLQRIPPPGEHGTRKIAIDASMDYLRQFAMAGVGVLVVSAVGRSRDNSGKSTYDSGMSLASFRETSELEFGADSAWILTRIKDSAAGVRALHLKDRHGECRDLDMTFDGARQTFTPGAPGAPTSPTGKRDLLAAVGKLWGAAPVADYEEFQDDPPF